MKATSTDSRDKLKTKLTKTVTLGIQDQVERCMEEQRLTNCTIVIAVSGGPDSSVLLHSLVSLRRQLNLKLHIAHLEHGIRGKEGEEDARYVEETCQTLGLPFTLRREDVEAYGRRFKLSTEEAARSCRYSFLLHVALEIGASAVVLGHTADDQVETVMLNILRGTGIYGLRGMPVINLRISGKKHVFLVRPLLGIRRSMVLEYCEEKGLVPRMDSSNDSIRFTRNRVRHQLLPSMRTFNPSLDAGLLRLAHCASLTVEGLEQETSPIWERVAEESEDAVWLNTREWPDIPKAYRFHILRRAYQTLMENPWGLTERHMVAMDKMLAGPSGKALQLPSGIRMYSTYGKVCMARNTNPLAGGPNMERAFPIAVPGKTSLPHWQIIATIHRRIPAKLEAAYGLKAYLDLDVLKGDLAARSRRPGDLFQPLGMEGKKKLQDFLLDRRVPKWQRDGIPLVTTATGIAWVVGERIAHWARVRQESRNILCLEFQHRL